MDIQAILRATFIVPRIEPEWQSGLLQKLGSTGQLEAVGRPAQALPAAEESLPVSVDMGQGSREQQYSRQRPVLRIVTPT